MVFQMEEDSFLIVFHLVAKCFVDGRVQRELLCAVEEWYKGVGGVSSGSEAAEEVTEVLCSVGFVRAECVDSMAVAYN